MMPSCLKKDALAPPTPSPETSPPFAFSHPLVYAFKVQDRVQALDGFIRRELCPKVTRLREEHDCIEHQLQRTMAKKPEGPKSVASSSTTRAKQTQSRRLKQQAWSWKHKSKRQELHRFEPFLELATDLLKISNELNPNILRLTVQWQRSQSIAPHKYGTADDSFDFDDGIEGRQDDESELRRNGERQKLARQYRNAFLENIRVSRSIQKRLDRFSAKESAVSNNTEDTAILSSLKIFSNNYCVCGSCQAMFHKDYLDALVIRTPNKSGEKAHDVFDNTSAYICIHCWNSSARAHWKEGAHEIEFGKLAGTESPPPTSNNSSDEKNKENQSRTTSTPTKSPDKKIPMQESARWKARKKVIKKRMVAAVAASTGGSSPDGKAASAKEATSHALLVNSKDNGKITSSTFEHLIGSMPSLDDSLSSIGESCLSCSKPVLGKPDRKEIRHSNPPSKPSLPPAKPISTSSITEMKLKMNSSAFQESNTNSKSKPNANKGNGQWGRFGSSESSICSNSIVESDPDVSTRHASASNKARFEMQDKIPIKRNGEQNRHESPDSSFSSLFSESSIGTPVESLLSASSLDFFETKYIKSAMKKTSSSSLKTGVSPTKVQDFPSGARSKKKRVRFRTPLVEYQEYRPHKNDLLDTSADIMNQVEYFCHWAIS